MMPGLYSYVFQSMLPAHLPTSVEGKYGYIRYTATVVIEFLKRPVKTFVEPFTVIRKTNWNTLVASRVNIFFFYFSSIQWKLVYSLCYFFTETIHCWNIRCILSVRFFVLHIKSG